METYKLFTKDPVKMIEEILLKEAIPLELKSILNELEKTNGAISKQYIFNNLLLLAFKGLFILRQKGQEKKQLYELFHGCVLSNFLNGIEPDYSHDVFYPENTSYDFLITKVPIDKKPDFKPLFNKEIHKNGVVFKIELVELTKLEKLEQIILNKSIDTKRILLVNVAFNGSANFNDLFNRATKINRNNFETIWLLGKINNPKDNNKLCYSVAELVKYKEIYPHVELNINWERIKDEVNKAFS